MHNYRDLKIWQRSMDLVVDVYKLTENFPSSEKYNLTSQLRRSGVSVPSNIAEGAGRNTNKQFQIFLEISLGSLNELITQLELSVRMNLVTFEEANSIFLEANEIQKMISVFHHKLSN